MDLDELRGKIRDIKDFPTEGILFKDITTLLRDGPAWAAVIDHLAARYHTARVDLVVGVESRGFIFGGALAHQLKAGFVPVRKRGKLPAPTIEEEYELEYGRDILAIHEDAVAKGQRVLVVDDLLATGGTMAATLILNLMNRPVESRERAYTEDVKRDALAPRPSAVDEWEPQPDGSMRNKKTGISVKVSNPCPAGDIEHEFALAAYNRSRSRR